MSSEPTAKQTDAPEPASHAATPAENPGDSAVQASEPAPCPETSAAAHTLSNFLLYTLSVPERAVRSTIALAGGAAREAAALLVPRAFQDSKSYEIVIRKSLAFLTEDIGGVERRDQPAECKDANYMARKAVGNFMDMTGIATLHLSPIWLLAIVSDVAYGSKSYLAELATELKSQGLIDETSTITRAEDVLEAVRRASGNTAVMLDTPPLSIDELKKSLEETRQAIGSADYLALLPQAELARYWEEMRQIAQRDQVSLLEVSSAITMHSLSKLTTIGRGTLTGLRVAGGLLNRHVISHYVDSLATLRAQGVYKTVLECYSPYVAAVWTNFAPGRATWTEEVVTGRLFGRIGGAVQGFFNKNVEVAAPSPPSQPTPGPPAPNPSQAKPPETNS